MEVELIRTFVPNPLCTRGQSFALGGDPKGKNFVYCVGKLVIIRNVDDPAKCEVYAEHPRKVTVAKYAPSGNYICSGDISGTVQIWDTTNPEHRMKSELRPFAGEIRDICWGPESRRIAACGQGSGTHAACVTWDTGNSLGHLTTHIKRANSIDFKPTRPYRLIVGDDEYKVVFYEGPPFKPKVDILVHSGFVNSVRFSPDGKYFVTGSSDTHVFLHDGKTAEMLGEFLDGKSCHNGGIYAISWSANSKEILTISGDKTAKIWDVESKQLLVKFVLGKDLFDQQTGCLWVGDTIISLSLSGNMTYLDRNNPDHPLKVVYGHSTATNKILALPIERPCHVTGDVSGKMLWWDTDTGLAHPFLGKGHTNKVTGICYDADTQKIISTAWDDTVRFTSASDFNFDTGSSVALDGQPQGIWIAGNYVVVNTNKSITLIKDEKKILERKHEYEDGFETKCLAAHGNVVVVHQESKVIKIFHIENDGLVESGTEIQEQYVPQVACYTPDGSAIAIGYSDKSIRIYNVSDEYKLLKTIYHHNQVPTVLTWSPNSQYLFSTSMDGILGCWNTASSKGNKIERAHNRSYISDLCCQSDEILLACDNDGLTKAWKVTC